MRFNTPVSRLGRLSTELRIDLRVKRDDLLPLTGGGNKVRKLARILEAEEQAGTGINALVTTGGLQSNHARVTALLAASRGWPCTLVLHTEPGVVPASSGNLLLMKLAGADLRLVTADEVASALESAREERIAEGLRPLVIPGGAHTLEGALAYADAVDEFLQDPALRGWTPDWVVLASGTGATQAGLVAGFARAGLRGTRVVGVSVARRNPRGQAAVQSSCEELARALRLEPLTVDFRDEWVGPGYEKPTPATLEALQHAARSEGLVLDPTYTGKAFAGLLDLVARGEIPRGARVLFWHTGGLLNLMTAPASVPQGATS
jgi:1-aminocyclopropane-1-carboxylate deaminase/D-cysteine desulfhydrase-like pyridoxal-dependent ACC family enzyme